MPLRTTPLSGSLTEFLPAPRHAGPELWQRCARSGAALAALQLRSILQAASCSVKQGRWPEAQPQQTGRQAGAAQALCQLLLLLRAGCRTQQSAASAGAHPLGIFAWQQAAALAPLHCEEKHSPRHTVLQCRELCLLSGLALSPIAAARSQLRALDALHQPLSSSTCRLEGAFF